MNDIVKVILTWFESVWIWLEVIKNLYGLRGVFGIFEILGILVLSVAIIRKFVKYLLPSVPPPLGGVDLISIDKFTYHLKKREQEVEERLRREFADECIKLEKEKAEIERHLSDCQAAYKAMLSKVTEL